MLSSSLPHPMAGDVSGASPAVGAAREEPAEGKEGEKEKSAKFERYIYRICRQTDPGAKISKKAMEFMNTQLIHTFHRLADESAALAAASGHTVVSDQDVRTVLNRLLPPDLALDAEALGNAALNHFGDEAEP